MNLLNNDNVTLNIDEIGKNPEEDKKLLYLLKMQTYRKNIIPIEEFNLEFSPLFQKTQQMNPTDLRDLAQRYMMRIDPYNPVFVVSDMSASSIEELLKESNVVFVLPAIYNRLGTVNDLKTKDGVEVGLEKMLAFNNLAAMDITDPFDKKHIRYSQELAAVFNAMTDPAKLQQNKAKAQAMAKKVLAPRDNSQQSDLSESIPEDILKDYQTASETDSSSSIGTEHEEFL